MKYYLIEIDLKVEAYFMLKISFLDNLTDTYVQPW